MRVLPTTKCLLIAVWMSMFLTTPGWAQAYPAEWDQMSYSQLAQLAQSRSPGAESIASYCPGRYDRDMEAGGFDWAGWSRLLSQVGQRVPADQRARLADDLDAHYRQQPQALAELSADAASDLVQSLVLLASPSPAVQLCQNWLERSPQAAVISAQPMVRLGMVLRALPEAAAVRSTLVGKVCTEYLAGKESTQQISGSQWSSLVVSFQRDLDSQQRQMWVAGLKRAFVDEPAFVATMDCTDILGVADAMVRITLEDKTVPGPLALQAARDGTWQQWGLWDKFRLVRAVDKAPVYQARPLVIQIGEAIVASHLGDGPEVLSQVTLAKWAQLGLGEAIVAGHLGDTPEVLAQMTLAKWAQFCVYSGQFLSQPSRRALADFIRNRYAAADEQIGSMSDEDFVFMRSALVFLRDPRAGHLLAKRLELCPTWDQGSPAALMSMIAELEPDTSEAVSARNTIFHHLTRQYTDPDRLEYQALSVADKVALGNAFLADGQTGLAAAWALKAYEKGATDGGIGFGSIQSLLSLGELLGHAGLTNARQEYPQYAAALAQLLASQPTAGQDLESGPEQELLAIPLCSDATRAVIREVLVDPSGCPRLEAAKLLTHAYHRAHRDDQWRAYLDKQIAETSGDIKAAWLIVRAYLEDAQPRQHTPLRGKQYLDQALVSAASQDMRLVILRELSMGYYLTGYYDESMNILDSQAGQYGDSPGFASLRQEMGMKMENSRFSQAGRQEHLKRRQEESRRNLLEHRRDAARERGDQAEVGRLEDILSRTSDQ